MADLKALFQYYLDHQTEFVGKYNGKYLVIKDNSVVGVSDKESETYFQSEAKDGVGDFIIQLCSPVNDAYAQHFMSRVAFVR